MNKKSIIKRLTSGILAATMMLSLAACGGKNDIPLASKENVFTSHTLEIPVKLDNISMVKSNGDYIYLYGTNDESKALDNGEWYWASETKLVVMDVAGNLVSESVLSKQGSDDEKNNEEKGYSENKYVNNAVLDNEGNFWALENQYKYVYETGEQEENFNIVKYTKDGVASEPINLNFLREGMNNPDDYFYINNFNIDNDGNIYVIVERTIFVLDNTGKILFKLESDVKQTDNTGSWFNSVVKASDGKMYVNENQYESTIDEYKNKNLLREIDIASQSFINTIEPKTMIDGISDGNSTYDCVLLTSSGMNGYDVETDTSTPIIDWMRSGFDSTAMQCSTIMSDGRILCATYKYQAHGGGYSYGGDGMEITILSKVDPADVPDKKLIKIACYYLNYEIRKMALDFNKNNPEYQIEIKSYTDDNNWNDALTNLNNDLIAGNIPDILLLENTMPINSYIAKGMFADLYKYIDADEEIKREDYLANIFDACSTDGKLYSLIPSFQIQTLVGKTSIVGENSGWTVDEFIEFANANSDKNLFTEETTGSNFINTILTFTINDYINYETGVCNFDTPEFIKILEFAKTLPTEVDYEELYRDSNYYMTPQMAYRENKTLVSDQYLSNFTSIREMEHGTFGEPITFKGFPTAQNSGSAGYANMNIAIMEKGKNSDGAWKFIKQFLQDEYQNNVSYSFPIKNSALEQQMEAAKQKPFYMDGEEKVEYENTMWLNDQEVKIGVNTDEDNQKVLNFIKSINHMISYDQDLQKIINEEIESFFSGQKPASEVANIIQNRVSVYVNESR